MIQPNFINVSLLLSSKIKVTGHLFLNLIDFGAGREFETEFLGQYLEIIHGAYTSDRKKIIDNSLKMKFLTGEENREMEEVHY